MLTLDFKPDNFHSDKLCSFDREKKIIYTIPKSESPNPKGGKLTVEVINVKQGRNWDTHECKLHDFKDVEIPDIELSGYQERIINFIESSKGHGVVNAVAGSGKTTTLLQVIKRVPKDKEILYMAFNRSIRDEMKNKIPISLANVVVETSHSIGYSIIRSHFWGGKRGKFNAGKYYDIVENHMRNWKINESKAGPLGLKGLKYELKKAAVDIVEKSMIGLVDYRNRDELYKVINMYSITWNTEACDNLIEHIPLIIEQGVNSTDEVSYSDMVYMPYYYQDELKFPLYDFILLDECQDLNAVQQFLFTRMIKPDTGRFLAVGDADQAIYAFNGADAESFNKLLNYPGAQELKLSATYRCSKRIVDMAKIHVPHSDIHALEDAPDGEVKQVKVADIKEGDMVLAATNLAVVKLAMILSKEGKKVHILGKDFAEELIRLLEEQDALGVQHKIAALRSKYNAQLEMKMKAMGAELALNDKGLELFKEKIECIEILTQGRTKMKNATYHIRNVFSASITDGITLSTAHKAKGLESERVFLIDDGVISPPRNPNAKDWEKKQNINLVYVAHTRAKNFLGYITDYQPYEKKKLVEEEELY